MTMWTLEQVRQASRLRAELAVDAELIHRHGEEVQRQAQDKMTRRLTEMAHPFGIELHPDDFVVEWMTDGPMLCQAIGLMRWEPRTREAELRGGELDGQRYSIRKIGEPLRVSRITGLPWLDANEHESSSGVVEMTTTYELVGWREGERVWVYEAR